MRIKLVNTLFNTIFNTINGKYRRTFANPCGDKKLKRKIIRTPSTSSLRQDAQLLT